MGQETTDLVEIFHKAKSGDEAARDQLARRSLEVLRRHFHGRLGRLADLEQTEDIACATVREVIDGLPHLDFRGESQWHAFLCRCAENRLRDRAKYHAAHKRRSFEVIPLEYPTDSTAAPIDPSLAAPGPGPHTTAERCEERRLVEDSLAQLPEEDAVLVMLKSYGYSVQEIATKLDLSPEVVQYRLRRVMVQLATIMRRKRRHTTEDE
ncbi:MAG: sigma-70 family RNA polymerase sigma factor [Planctomycetota bacterium]